MSTSTELAPIKALKAELPTLQRLILINAPKGIDAEALVLQELEYLGYHMMQKPELTQCTPASVVLAVKTVLKQNLSLDPYAGLVYIKTRNIKTKSAQGHEITVQGLEIQPSCNGLLSIARQCRRILDMKRPQVTKDQGTRKVNGVYVDFLLPSTPEPRWERFEFDEDDFHRWQLASHKERRGEVGKLDKANALFTSWAGGIDPEFARAKAIRHALKKLGTNRHENMQTFADYGIKIKTDIDSNMDNQAADDDNIQDVNHEVLSSSPLTQQGTDNETIDPSKL